ncbi:glycosyltransferase [Candidatus Daviesbacteria bacterium]|nr:glycosyltransferase [Candidatus Daviesbacteria bacterium]
MYSKLPISIIVPVLNEGSNITLFLQTLERAIKIKHEIIIVYDFDQDDTVPVAKKLQHKFSNIRLIKNNLGRGLINACKTGFKKAKGNFIVVMPGDLADDPKAINNMYKLAKQGYDIVCGTRYSKGGKQLGGGFMKTVLSRIAGLTTPVLLGIPTSDLTNGFKLYRNSLLDKIGIESQGGWEFAMEILIKAHFMGFKITETPSTWKERSSGKSKFKLYKWLPRYIYWYGWGITQRLIRS